MSALTETIVTGLLRDKLTKPGNGGSGEHAFMAQVRNAAGFDATRTFDAVSINLWPSRGLGLHIYEVKVSRSDWQRELAKPDKAEDACKIAEQFTIVAPAGCVRDGELPPTWGLIEVGGDGTDDKPWKLRTVKVAPLLHNQRPGPIPRGLVVGMLRAIPGAVPGGKNVSIEQRALDASRAEGRREGVESMQARLDNAQEQYRQLVASVAEFEHAAGITLRGFRGTDVAAIGKAVRAVLDGDSRIADQQRLLAAVQRQLRNAADGLDQFVLAESGTP